MSDDFNAALVEFYQGEIIGEVALDRLVAETQDPTERYKLATMLQLETETKARLRPALLARGLCLAETETARDQGVALAEHLSGRGWNAMMAALEAALVPYVERYRAIAANAPTAGREVAASMVVHEQSFLDFARLEQKGDAASLDAVVMQLV